MTKIIYQCDLCGKEVNVVDEFDIVVDFYNDVKHKEKVEICRDCLEKYNNAVNSAATDFVRNTIYFKTHCNSKGNFIDVGKFKMVGNSDQGGYKCPRCYTVIDVYHFHGVCNQCGYEE